MEQNTSIKSYQDIFEFSHVADNYKKRTNLKDSKLIHALTKMTGDAELRKKGILSEVISDFYDKQNDLKLEYAAVDSNGIIIRDANMNYRYTKESERALIQALKDLNNKYITIDSFYIKEEEIPKDLNQYELDFFKGFVIKPTE